MFCLLLAVPAPSPIWYKSPTLSFAASVPGDPYDAEASDAKFEVRTASRRSWVSFPAYFEDGVWRGTLVTKSPGAFEARLRLGGKVLTPIQRSAATTPLPGQFVHRGGSWGFELDDRSPYWPIGHDLAWQGAPGMPDLTECLAQMGVYGAHWTRIWATHWDGKNPWWHKATASEPEDFMEPNAVHRWDAIVAAAEKADVKFNFTLFHHGQFTTHNDSNWAENPWNVKNGGWLKDPKDFFTDPKAIHLAKCWIRYAVARWGSSPSVFGWELFNEVEWTNGAQETPEAVGAWHDMMAKYVRSLDPYKHLVCTSSRDSLPIYREVDYLQPHTYPSSVSAALDAYVLPKDKPAFFGEIGPGDFDGPEPVQRRAIRDGIYTALFDHHAGAGEYWTWDKVYSLKLQNEWRTASAVLSKLRPFDLKDWKTFPVSVESAFHGDLQVHPGGGWEANKAYEFDLPGDKAKFGLVSSYFQGTGHKDMRERPLTFKFHLDQPGQLRVMVAGVSDSGGNIEVKANGQTVIDKHYVGKDQKQAGYVTGALPAGDLVVTLDNDGPDWLRLTEIDFPGIGSIAEASGGGDAKRGLVRLIRQPLALPGSSISLSGLGLADGSYEAETTDLDTGATLLSTVQVSAGRLKDGLDVTGQDSVVRFAAKG